MFIVIWALSVGALVLSSVQLFGYRHAMLGRQTVARVQARWAARGGLEYTIAVMADHTMQPVGDDAFAMVRGMDEIATGTFESAEYDIRHHSDGRSWWGPMDEHSKVNINAAPDNPSLLAAVDDDMSPDIVDAILDWIDADEDERPLGAERHYYLGLSMPYEPRNAPMRNISELELVAGIWPEHLRGEDWNLNHRLDDNENDGDRTWPPDEPDDRLDAAWSGIWTTHSVAGGLTASGLPRINLRDTEVELLMERLEMEETTASSLINFAGGADARLEQLLVQQMATKAAPDGQQATTGLGLTDDQLRAVLDETVIGDPEERGPGRLNINTVSEELLLKLLVNQEHLADEILYLRTSRPEGITSLVDLIEIPAFQDEPASLEYLAGIMSTRSNVYSVTSVGRSWSAGVEVEIYAVVDRSTVPVRILEYRE